MTIKLILAIQSCDLNQIHCNVKMLYFSYSLINPFMKLASDRSLRKQVDAVTNNIVVEDVQMLFSSDACGAVDGVEIRSIPMAYVPHTDAFVLSYLERLSKYVSMFFNLVYFYNLSIYIFTRLK